MAQLPPDQNFYLPHAHPHAHLHQHAHPHPQLQLPPEFRNPFDLIFDERTGATNYNYLRPYISSQLTNPDDLSDPLVMRRRRRTRTTFTSAQVAALEQHFLEGRYLTSSRLAELADKLALGTAQVKIWFKNRRRRYKIQSDQQKDCPNDGMPPSPSMPNTAKSEAHGSGSSCGSSNTSTSGSSGGPPSLQSLSLNVSNGSTSNALTPSPTSTKASTNSIDHYGESAFNPYYYSSHHHQVHHGHAPLSHPYAATANAAGAQYYPSPPPQANLQHHQHHHPQYHNSPLPHQFQMQHKREESNKEDPDFNYNNSYYMGMPTAGAPTVTPLSAISPNPNNDESSSLCSGESSGSSVDTGDDVKETQAELGGIVFNEINSTNNACRNTDPVGNRAPATPEITIIKDCTDAFSKYKMISDPNDPNYQCTMDTIMHAYNNHRNTTVNSQQFAYCFN